MHVLREHLEAMILPFLFDIYVHVLVGSTLRP